MKLSEAMRKGAALRPQGFNRMFPGDASCALGAAVEGATGNRSVIFPSLFYMFPILKRRAAHPVAGEVRPVDVVILSLNDEERWSRERIADWIATLEAA